MRRLSLFAAVTALAAVFSVGGCGGGVDNEASIVVRPASKSPSSKPANGGTDIKKKASGNAGTGTFKGSVTFVGTAPDIGPPAGFNPSDEKHKACLSGGHQVKDYSLVVNKANQGLKNVFIYLVEAPEGYTPSAAESTPLIFDQQGCTFEPHALIIRTGRVLELRNSDNLLHNTNISPLKNPAFSKTLGKTGENVKPGTYKYENSIRKPFKVTCEFHKFMSAYHLALDHPFFALTDKNGQFEIKDLPEGDYTFTVWHEKFQGKKKIDVTIEPGETTEKNNIKF